MPFRHSNPLDRCLLGIEHEGPCKWKEEKPKREYVPQEGDHPNKGRKLGTKKQQKRRLKERRYRKKHREAYNARAAERMRRYRERQKAKKEMENENPSQGCPPHPRNGP